MFTYVSTEMHIHTCGCLRRPKVDAKYLPFSITSIVYSTVKSLD